MLATASASASLLFTNTMPAAPAAKARLPAQSRQARAQAVQSSAARHAPRLVGEGAGAALDEHQRPLPTQHAACGRAHGQTSAQTDKRTARQ